MANEATYIEGWIYKSLSTNNVISAAGIGVYPGLGEDDDEKLLVTYSFVPGSLVSQQLGVRRGMVRADYDIKAIVAGTGGDDFRQVVDVIDTLFGNAVRQVHLNWYFTSRLQDLLSMVERDNETQQRWTHRGGTYRISAYPL